VAESRELQAFRLAIALTEGGGKVDYTQTNADGAVGAYQFLTKYWDWYSSNAGYPDADINDPRVQDAVARYWFNKNYNDLGSWELAAIAHFAGRTTAFEAKQNGIESVMNIQDSTGTTIGDYVNKAMQHYREQIELYAKVDKDVAAMNLPDFGAGFGGTYKPEEIVSKEAATVLDVITNAMSDNGRKKFPMNTKAQFQSQVPKQAGMYEDAKLITQVRRDL
tara:strand:- start:132 stop:794 length:663 start_codon:yes stop_codon:yes gene_type:complete